ncbi:MAG TPA: hypothetical protein VFM18_11145, partial [Methanosarcina sp.]|nr:hypothetical protein [Methanosarcina sp.]
YLRRRIMHNKEGWKTLLPIIQALVEGKTIQYQSMNGGWFDLSERGNISFSESPARYRIKPEKKKRKGWMNVYNDGSGLVYITKESADDAMSAAIRSACIEIEYEYEEGEGL